MTTQGLGALADRARGAAAAYSAGQERPLRGYLASMTAYSALAGGLALLGRKRLPERFDAGDVALIALGGHKLSRLVTKEAVTSPIRAPFTRFEGPQGNAELREEVRGEGVRHAVGELLSCPFCLDVWSTTALAFSFVFAPRAGRFAATVLTAIAGADSAQLAYAWLQQRASG